MLTLRHRREQECGAGAMAGPAKTADLTWSRPSPEEPRAPSGSPGS